MIYFLAVGFFYIILCIIITVYADKNGRNGFLAFLVSLILSPAIGLLIYILAGKSTKIRVREIIQDEKIRVAIRTNNTPELENIVKILKESDGTGFKDSDGFLLFSVVVVFGAIALMFFR